MCLLCFWAGSALPEKEAHATQHLSPYVLHALEDYHPATAAHSRRVACYAALLLPRCGPELVHALLCHDAGKLEVPHAILSREGALEKGDWPLLAAHPAQSETHLQALAGRFLGGALPRSYAVVARSHHERWDGHGYPDGLAGRHIPYLARIAAILDSFDAMTTRTYRQPLSAASASAAIRRGAASQFDPRLAHDLGTRLPTAALVVLPTTLAAVS